MLFILIPDECRRMFNWSTTELTCQQIDGIWLLVCSGVDETKKKRFSNVFITDWVYTG